MMYDASTDRPYYYTLDRMYNIRRLVDRAGAIVERYMYDPYGRPYVTEMLGRGDMNNNVAFQTNDASRLLNAQSGAIWDPRADLDDDGDVDQDDNDAFSAKWTLWNQNTPTVRQAFSDVGNPYMFQGRPHFALDTTATATEATLMLNDHRARFCDPVIGRWLTRDMLGIYPAVSAGPIEGIRSTGIKERRFDDIVPLQATTEVIGQYADGISLYESVSVLLPKSCSVWPRIDLRLGSLSAVARPKRAERAGRRLTGRAAGGLRTDSPRLE